MSKVIITLTYHEEIEYDLEEHGYAPEIMWSDLTQELQDEITDSDRENKILEIGNVVECEKDEFEDEEQY